MRLSKDKYYKVEKFTENSDVDYGVLSGSEVRLVIGNAKYDELLEMFFVANGKTGYSVEEVK